MTSPLQQKLKITGPMVVTANRLGDGAVVYRTRRRRLDDRARRRGRHDGAGGAQELLDCRQSRRLRAVDPYVAPVKLEADGRVLPAICAKRIRSARPDHRPADHVRH